MAAGAAGGFFPRPGRGFRCGGRDLAPSLRRGGFPYPRAGLPLGGDGCRRAPRVRGGGGRSHLARARRWTTPPLAGAAALVRGGRAARTGRGDRLSGSGTLASQCAHRRFEDGRTGLGARHGLAHGEADASAEAPRQPHSPEHPVASAPHALPQAAQGDWHHRHGSTFEDPLESSAEGLNLTVGGEPSLGEDADQFPRRQRTVHGFEGPLEALGVFLGGGDGDGARGAEGEGEQRDAEDAVVHDEADGPPDRSHEDQGIDIAHVVADEQRRPLLGDALEALGSDAVKQAHDQPDQESQQELGNEREDDPGHHQVEQSHDQEQFRDRQADGGEPGGQAGGGDDEGGVEDVVGGDDPCAFSGFAALLDQRIERNDVETGEDPDQQEVEAQPQAAFGSEERGKRLTERADFLGPRAVHVEGEEGHAGGAEGHQADLDALAGEPLAGERADGDAHREEGEHEQGERFLSAERVFHPSRSLRGEHGAIHPEPGDAKHRQQHRPFAPEDAQAVASRAPGIEGQGETRVGRWKGRNPAAGEIAEERKEENGDPGDERSCALDRHPVRRRRSGRGGWRAKWRSPPARCRP